MPEPVRLPETVARGGMLSVPLWPAATVIAPVSVPQLVALSAWPTPLRFSTEPFWNVIGPVPMALKPLAWPPPSVVVPAARTIPPEKPVLEPVSVSRPAPVRVIGCVPASEPLKVVPLPAASVLGLVATMVRPVVNDAGVCNAPPASTTEAFAPRSPRFSFAEIASVPPATVVEPV